MHEEQANTPVHEKPKLLVEDIARKIGELDREVKYLINKAKTFRPKPKVNIKPENDSTPTKEETVGSDQKEEEEAPPKASAGEDCALSCVPCMFGLHQNLQ